MSELLPCPQSASEMAREIADGLSGYLAEPRRAELEADILEALAAERAKVERLKEVLKEARDFAEMIANDGGGWGWATDLLTDIDAALKDGT